MNRKQVMIFFSEKSEGIKSNRHYAQKTGISYYCLRMFGSGAENPCFQPFRLPPSASSVWDE